MLKKTFICIILAVFAVQSTGSAMPAGLVPATAGVPSLCPVFRGIRVDAKDPLSVDFILDPGAGSGPCREEVLRLLRYFLASVAIPENDLWVNLSPYEKERVIPEALGTTEMGRDLLEQDHYLKKVTSDLLHPDGTSGRAFWAMVYAAVPEGADIPAGIFNKVWIVPQLAEVYEDSGMAVITRARLKVMLGEDRRAASIQGTDVSHDAVVLDALRRAIIPVLEKEVNEGAGFAPLRQVFHALILAKWYKGQLLVADAVKNYADRKMVRAIGVAEKHAGERVWQEYVRTFAKGAFNYIREDVDPDTGEIIPRRYFSGGVGLQFRLDKAEARPQENRPLLRLRARFQNSADNAALNQVPDDRHARQKVMAAVQEVYPALRLRKIAGVPSLNEVAEWFMPYAGLPEHLFKDVLQQAIRVSLKKEYVANFKLDSMGAKQEHKRLLRGVEGLVQAGHKDIIVTTYGGGLELSTEGRPDKQPTEFDMTLEALVKADEAHGSTTDVTFVVYERNLALLADYGRQFEAFERQARMAYPQWKGRISGRVFYGDVVAGALDRRIGKAMATWSHVTFWRHTWVGDSGHAALGTIILTPKQMEYFYRLLKQAVPQGVILVKEWTDRIDDALIRQELVGIEPVAGPVVKGSARLQAVARKISGLLSGVSADIFRNYIFDANAFFQARFVDGDFDPEREDPRRGVCTSFAMRHQRLSYELLSRKPGVVVRRPLDGARQFELELVVGQRRYLVRNFIAGAILPSSHLSPEEVRFNGVTHFMNITEVIDERGRKQVIVADGNMPVSLVEGDKHVTSDGRRFSFHRLDSRRELRDYMAKFPGKFDWLLTTGKGLEMSAQLYADGFVIDTGWEAVPGRSYFVLDRPMPMGFGAFYERFFKTQYWTKQTIAVNNDEGDATVRAVFSLDERPEVSVDMLLDVYWNNGSARHRIFTLGQLQSIRRELDGARDDLSRDAREFLTIGRDLGFAGVGTKVPEWEKRLAGILDHKETLVRHIHAARAEIHQENEDDRRGSFKDKAQTGGIDLGGHDWGSVRTSGPAMKALQGLTGGLQDLRPVLTAISPVRNIGVFMTSR